RGGQLEAEQVPVDRDRAVQIADREARVENRRDPHAAPTIPHPPPLTDPPLTRRACRPILGRATEDPASQEISNMKLCQYFLPRGGKRVGVVEDGRVVDITSRPAKVASVLDLIVQGRSAAGVEPELARVVGAQGDIVGYTCGNDLAAWDIERANPLYLPQSKMFRGCFAFGPVLVTAGEIRDPHALEVRCRVRRGGALLYEGKV